MAVSDPSAFPTHAHPQSPTRSLLPTERSPLASRRRRHAVVEGPPLEPNAFDPSASVTHPSVTTHSVPAPERTLCGSSELRTAGVGSHNSICLASPKPQATTASRPRVSRPALLPSPPTFAMTPPLANKAAATPSPPAVGATTSTASLEANASVDAAEDAAVKRRCVVLIRKAASNSREGDVLLSILRAMSLDVIAIDYDDDTDLCKPYDAVFQSETASYPRLFVEDAVTGLHCQHIKRRDLKATLRTRSAPVHQLDAAKVPLEHRASHVFKGAFKTDTDA